MNRVRSVLSSVASGFLTLGRGTAGGLMLVGQYLSHLFWLMESDLISLFTQAYRGNSAVYGCIRLLADSVPEPPCVPHLVDKTGGVKEILPYRHPARKLLRSPNQFLTEALFWEMTTIFVAAAGISYWWKERSYAGAIKAYWPLRPDRVGPIYANPEDQAKGARVIIGWSYLPPGAGRPIGLEVEDVLVFHRPDPAGATGGLVEGFGPLQAIISEVSVDNEATKFVGSLIANHATPGIVLKTRRGLAKTEQAQLIKQAFIQEFGGTRRGEPAVIDGDSEIQEIGFNLQEMEFKGIRHLSESRIAAAFGTPAILVGLSVGLEAGIRATMEETRKLFAETTCAGYWRRYAAVMSEELSKEYGADIACAFDLTKVRALTASFDAELVKYMNAYERGAIYLDEYRAKLNFPPLPNGAGQVLAMNIAPGGGQQALTGEPLGKEAPRALDAPPAAQDDPSPPASS